MSKVTERLAKLREKMHQKNIDAWIAPSADSHQSEYVAEHWKCRQWISGFTGSAGTVVITKEKAGLWTDSRYFIQAEKELEGSGITLFKMGKEDVPTYTEWLQKNVDEEAIVGFDGSLLSVKDVNKLVDELSEKRISLSYNIDLIDQIWEDRPAVPEDKIFELSEKETGETRQSKLTRLREKLSEYEADSHLIATLDDIAWIFNIRGEDIAYNPVAIAYAYIDMDKAYLFIDSKKIPSSVQESLENDSVELNPYKDIFKFLDHLKDDHKIVVDFSKISQKLKDSISDKSQLIEKMNIATELKTIKNEVEIDGFKNAHLRDGAAMVKWLYWIENNVGKIEMDEVSVAEKLKEFRAENDKFVGLSFSTITGYKENGAIVHYSAKKETAAKIRAEGVLLVDSGAQYFDGTTDITRTISMGNPREVEKEAFTTVLRGHINLAKAIFPKGYTGAMVDTFSRAAIWEKYYNYGHGTGHGVGHFLNVHEGPQQIRPTNHYEIKEGMVHSNEPGMYLEGQFGIRIENLIHTVKKEKNQYGTFLGFETITQCPIDLSLVNKSMMTKEEVKWLNDYHQAVFDNIKDFLSTEEKEWLREKTQKI